MLRNLYFLGFVLLFSTSSLLAQVGSGEIRGKLTDAETGEPLPFVNIVLQAGDRQVAGGTTDFDGNYIIKPVPPGTYNVLVSSVGYNAKQIQGVTINSGRIRFLDIPLEAGIRLDEIEVVEYSRPLIEKDGTASGGTVTREDITRMATRSATAVATTVGGVQETSSGDVSIRGARTENTYYYIDGIKVRGTTQLPKGAIEEVSVMTGGIPASYGDATGGIISITTRGASSEYFGSIDVLSSGFANKDGKGFGLDRYARSQIEGVISGPLFWRKDAEGNRERPLLGFFVSANYTNNLDANPRFSGYRIKQDSRQELLNNPLSFRTNSIDTRPSEGVVINNNDQIVSASFVEPNVQGISNGEFLRLSDVEKIPARQDMRNQRVSGTVKLDVATSPNLDLAFGGTFDWYKGRLYSYAGSLMNSANNGEQISQTWRAFGRFTHRFTSDASREGDALIKNAFYSIMVDYSQTQSTVQDPIHKDNLFNYGYVGKFDVNTTPYYEYVESDTLPVGFHQKDEQPLSIHFTPSDINKDLASYTSALFKYYDQQGYPVRSLDDIARAGGLYNGLLPSSIYNLYNPIGTPYNAYQLSRQDQFRVTGSGSADVGGHAIVLGFEFEQYTQRGFGANPVGLWTQAYNSTNSHIQEWQLGDRFVIDGQDFYSYDRIIDLPSQYRFDRNLRTKLGLDPNGRDFINIHGLDPNLMSLDMFNANELLRAGNNALVSYYGYDYKGDIVRGRRPTIDDFFNQRSADGDAKGDLTRPIGAFEPIYIAGYIMDKFAFDDIIFNVGVRIDRFDANQPVLKDKYIVGEALHVSDTYDPASPNYFGEHPANVKDDWVVYVNDIENPTAITGYRSGDTWYDKSGAEVEKPSQGGIMTSSGIAPLLRKPSEVGENLTGDAFESYKPQINVMPRISFSFPISDEAVFFAHYDILTQRPEGRNIMNPIDYLFIQNITSAIDNPNLRPTKTIDYELGFQQVVSRTSSLKISAFYRETRDEIQVRKLLGAFPVSYLTFDNYDFGTTKGLTLAYDLRRTGNITMRASYTLQFAAATGSGATSSLSLVNSDEPNLRVIFPTDRDQRHVFVTSFDFRYGKGKEYNGPIIGGKQILANSGLNIIANLGSGTPYSRQQRVTSLTGVGGAPQLQGSVNGSLLPWQFRINAQLDKTFDLTFAKESEKPKRAFLNVYLLVNNLLNTKNIINVYRFTGNPDDDGFIASPDAEPVIRNTIDPESFRQLYNLKVANPLNYSMPRTIQLGVRLDF